MSQYKQLTYEQRCQIEALIKSGMLQREIAEAVGVSQSTISRELGRNRGKRGYRHKQAHRKAAERKQQAARAIKMTDTMIALIEEKLRDRWSPEQVSGWLLKECDEMISHERIYQHIWNDKRAGGDL